MMSRIVARSKELTQLQGEASDDAAERGSKERREQDAFIKAVKDNRNYTDKQLAGVAAQFNRGEISGRDFQSRVTQLETAMRGHMKGLGYTFTMMSCMTCIV